jgi:lycopene cyclase domain-containing protein
MKYAYLLILAATLIGPLVLSFEKNVKFHSKWRYALPGLIIISILFIFWDSLFVTYNVWDFNRHYVVNLFLVNLPLEECLFFIVVPFSGLFIYECVRYYEFQIPKFIITFLDILLITTTSLISINHITKLYTSINGLLFVGALAFLTINNVSLLKYAIPTLFISILPFLIVNGLLTSIPIVIYNPDHILGIRLGSIPIEDTLYGWTLLLSNIWAFEHQRSRALLNYAQK